MPESHNLSRARLKADYIQLVQDRQGCDACDGLTNPSEVDCGVFDSEHVGPWTRWEGNLSARLFVVGQD